jgi:hypothetical protein
MNNNSTKNKERGISPYYLANVFCSEIYHIFAFLR